MKTGSGERPLIAFNAFLDGRTIGISPDKRDSVIADLVKVLHCELRTLCIIDSSVVESRRSTSKSYTGAPGSP